MARTSEDLREFLFSTLLDVRAGRCNPETANAIAKLTGQIISTVAIEIEYHRHVTKEVGGNAAAPSTRIALTRRDPIDSNSQSIESPAEKLSARDRIADIARRPV